MSKITLSYFSFFKIYYRDKMLQAIRSDIISNLRSAQNQAPHLWMTAATWTLKLSSRTRSGMHLISCLMLFFNSSSVSIVFFYRLALRDPIVGSREETDPGSRETMACPSVFFILVWCCSNYILYR